MKNSKNTYPIELYGRLSSVESLGALDGPGLRTVFFLQGCPARCLYCHNPETQVMQGGKVVTVSDIVEIAKKNRPYFGKKGGVTFSGGEPLVQAQFVLQCIFELKELGIHTCVDTSGVVFDKDIFDNVDLILLDIKHTDREQYKKIVGCPIDICLKIVEYLTENKRPFVVRQVICDGLNTDSYNIEQLKQIAKAAIKIELLPYHAMARHKYQRLAMSYPDQLVEPNLQTMQRLNEMLEN